MLMYYLNLAVRSMRRSPWLSLLMIGAIGMGIGASMTQLSVWHALSGNPIPARSDRLFTPYLDARPARWSHSTENQAGVNLSWPDAQALLREARAPRQAAMAGANILVTPPDRPQQPFFADGRYTTTDFFPMFALPLVEGHYWNAGDDMQRARVVVLDQSLARQLFPHGSAIGQSLRLHDTDFQVIGISRDWQPEPLFYADPSGNVYGHPDRLFIPLSTAVELKLSTTNNLSCWSNHGDDSTSGDCIWLQYWTELDTPLQRQAYLSYLHGYWIRQLQAGRFMRPDQARIDALLPWLVRQKLIPADLSMQLGLSFGFLLVCLLNIVGLLLARFMRARREIGLRRALGARHADIFIQLGCEAGLIGVAGASLGLLLSQLGLWVLRQRPDDYAHMARMDFSMLVTAILLAVLGSLLAGLVPAWRVCRLPPAHELKAV